MDDWSDSGEESDESTYSMQLNGKKFSVTKTSLRGEYSFNFVKDAAFLAKTKEEQIKFIELQMKLRDKKLLVKKRIENQNSIDDFIRPLLNNDVLNMFAKIQSGKHFKSKVLPVNFPGGHQ